MTDPDEPGGRRARATRPARNATPSPARKAAPGVVRKAAPAPAYEIAVVDEPGVDGDRARLIRMASHALAALGVPAGAEMAVSLVGTDRIAELKRQFFGEAAATDVLSFPMDDPARPSPGPLVLGDVVLCPEVAARQARALGRTLGGELDLLLVHGILHLLGRDHDEPAGERSMRGEERRILASFAGASGRVRR